MKLGKFSMGIGDRFAHQGKAQLTALQKAEKEEIVIIPVWNKSFREHQIIHSQPSGTRLEADEAVKALSWKHPYFVDADHIGVKSVDHFIDSADFFTLDVADFIGKSAEKESIDAFTSKCSRYLGDLKIPGIDESFHITKEIIETIAGKYLFAAEEAGRIYRHILEKKGEGNFVVEVSMDETDAAQTPIELFFILAAISFEKIPVQTIAPKFSGRFNKGVDYVGNVDQFAQEFEQDLAVIDFAVKEFSLPDNLKLSVHSGSDKFSIYTPIQKALKKFNAGLHLKTAGTTWLEELIGLACAEGEGLKIAKDIYRIAYGRFDELCGPYKTVIDVHMDRLPSPDEVDTWTGKKYADVLRHDQSNKDYSTDFRQLLHVSYKVAAEFGGRYLNALKENEKVIAQNVIENLYERHIKKIF